VHVRSAALLASVELEDWTIFMKEGTTTQQLEEFCRDQCTATGNPSKGGVEFAEFHGSVSALNTFLNGNTDRVAFIEPEVMEDAFNENWVNENRDASAESSLWGLERIGVSARSTTGEGVNIFVLDTGVRTTHVDFEGRAVSAIQTNFGRVQVCDGSVDACAVDRNGHGSHCAGTAAGKTYGVASGATVHGIKAVGDNGRGFQSWVVMGLDWVATDGPRPAVASISLQFNGESWSMETSVRRATQQGVIVVVAAGNVNNFACNFSPAFVPEAITVGATAQDDTKAQFSNAGSCVNLWAPGVDITSAVQDDDTASDTWSGTSMACPHVAGAAALLLQDNSELTRDQIMTALAANGEKDIIGGLQGSDANLLVNVRGTR